jgi:hypothetical protein
MPGCSECNLSHPPTPPVPPSPPFPPPLDLDAYSEATRRGLYDIVAAIHFAPPELPECGYTPRYTAEESGLLVCWIMGRWICAWQPLEELGGPYLPPAHRSVLPITEAPGAPFGVDFHAV